MARTPRRESASNIHHVMSRGVDRQTIFFADVDRIRFGRELAKVHLELGLDVLAYCLMDNHFHLLVRAADCDLAEALQRVLSAYVRFVNDRLGRDGPLFRGRFHSIPVETDEYLQWVTRYIHLNPLDLPGVTDPAAYRWSSLSAYLGLRPPPKLLDTATVMSYFGGSTAAFRRFMDGGDAAPVREPFTASDVRSLVACAVAVDDLTHGRDDEARQALERTVLILLSRRVDDPAVGEALRDVVGQRSGDAARMAASRAERRLRDEPAVGRMLTWTMSELARLRPAV